MNGSPQVRAATTPTHAVSAAGGGFTLLELLVVMGILSVLTGMAIGTLRRTDPSRVAASMLAGERRAAQVTARSQGVPCEVVVRPGGDGEAATVQALLLRPVTVFGFEPGQGVYDEAYRPIVGGEDAPNGRFGHARKPLAGSRDALLRWPVDAGVMDLRDGFVCRLDLWIEARGRATVLRLPPAVELSLDDELRPTARLRLRGDNGPSLAAVPSEIPLPLQRWCTLDVCCNGRTAWLQLDGREIATVAAVGSPLQEADSVFEVSPAEAPIQGLVDEVRWFVYEFAPSQSLPIELRPARVYRFAYDLHGDPTAEPEIKWLAPNEDS